MQPNQDEQQSLAFLFSQPQPEPEPRKVPALYRSYIGGNCQNPTCGEPLGHIETDGGRDRLYCNDACRVAAYRARQREQKRAEILQRHEELREYWQEHDIHGEVLLRLQEILLQHGKLAARAATDAVLVALAIAEQTGSNEQSRLIEEVMLGGEASGYPEIRFDAFRIPTGVEAWSAFVTSASTNYLREVRYYLYNERQQRAVARQRLEALGGDPQ